MNILIVTAMFPPIQTGTSFYSKNLAGALKKAGHDVALVTVMNNDAIKDQYDFDVFRIKCKFFPIRNKFKHLRICSMSLSNYRFISKLVRTRETDIILLINHYLDIAFPAIYAAKKNHIPMVVSVGTQLQSLNPFNNRVLRLLDRLICGHLIYPSCKKIISWDKEIERYIKDIQSSKTAKKSVVVPYGVNGDISVFEQHQHKYELHNQMLGVGAIIHHRNFLFHIRVFKELLVDFPDLTLKIIGHIYTDAPIKLAEELGISENVVFTGELPHDQVLKELEKSDLHWMMLAGEYVGLGTSTIESMMMGVPIISNVPEDLLGEPRLKDFHDFIQTDGASIKNTVSKIKEVLNDEKLRKRIGQNGRMFVKENMNWDIVAKKMTAHLNECI